MPSPEALFRQFGIGIHDGVESHRHRAVDNTRHILAAVLKIKPEPSAKRGLDMLGSEHLAFNLRRLRHILNQCLDPDSVRCHDSGRGKKRQESSLMMPNLGNQRANSFIIDNERRPILFFV